MPQDYVQAHKWFNLAGSGAAASEEALRDRAIGARERVAAAMTPEQLAEAQRLARGWESSRQIPLAQRSTSFIKSSGELPPPGPLSWPPGARRWPSSAGAKGIRNLFAA